MINQDVPIVSVVIAFNNAHDVIEECLDGLLQQRECRSMEIIVVDGSTDGTSQIIAANYPTVRLLNVDGPQSLSLLRGRGIAVTRGKIIAVLDPSSIVDGNWLTEVIRVHSVRDNPVIGGAVELYGASDAGILTWAKYINEYGMFMLPMEEQEIEILPGSNISYKRDILFDGTEFLFPDFWKTFVNWKVEMEQGALWFEPSVVVHLRKPVPFWDFLSSRFQHGRCFAAMRINESGTPERIFRIASAPGIPFVLLLRWSKRYLKKRRYTWKLIATLPIQFLLFGNWALGELVGYCTGGIRSCSRLYY